MRKEKVLEAINNFPPEFELEELIEKLIFMEKVEKGLAQLDQGEVKAQEEVKNTTQLFRSSSSLPFQENPPSARKPGLAKGLIQMREDFDEPLEDFKEYME